MTRAGLFLPVPSPVGVKMKLNRNLWINTSLTLVLAALGTNVLAAQLGQDSMRDTNGKRVMSAVPMTEGTSTFRMNIDHGQDVDTKTALPEDESTIGTVDEVSFQYAYQVLPSLELNLGVGLVSEPSEILVESQSSKETRLKAARIGAKFYILNSDVFGLAVGGWGATTSTTGAEASFLRPTSPHLGLVAIATLSYPQVISFHLNGGMEYRKPESFESRYFRNAMIYGAELEFHIMENFDVFTSAQGRTMKTRTVATTIWEDLHSLSYEAGLKLALADFDFVLSAGQAHDDRSFGMAKSMIGLSLGYQIGSSRNAIAYKKSRMGHGRNADDEDESFDSESYELEETKSKARPAATKGRSLSDDVSDIDFVNDMEKSEGGSRRNMDDFELIEKRMRKERQLNAQREDDVEKELEELRKIEERQRLEDERIQKRQEQAARRVRSEQYRRERGEYNKLYRQVKDEVDELPTVTNSDIQWNGLE
jgi:hypothetical protein